MTTKYQTPNNKIFMPGVMPPVLDTEWDITPNVNYVKSLQETHKRDIAKQIEEVEDNE